MLNQNPFDVLSFWFFQKALLLSVFAAIPCAIIGTYIVIKRISLITGSISHSAFGGLGIGYFFSFNPLLGAFLFCVASGTTIGWLQQKAKNRLDTILSFLWAFGMAIGLIFVALTPGYATDLFSYLFGNIFLVDNTEMIFLIVLNIIILVVVFLMFHTLKTTLFDEEFAEVRNLRVSVIYVVFYSLISLTVIVILMIVGVVLLIAFLTLPAGISLFYKKKISGVMIMAGVLIAIINTVSLFLAHFLNLPPGPIIVLILSLVYLSSLILKTVRKRVGDEKSIVPHACEVELASFGIFEKYIDDERYETSI